MQPPAKVGSPVITGLSRTRPRHKLGGWRLAAAIALVGVAAPFLGTQQSAFACSDQDAYTDPRAQGAIAAVAANDQEVADGEQAAQQNAAATHTLNTRGYQNQRITVVLTNGWSWNCGSGAFVSASPASAQPSGPVAPAPPAPPPVAGSSGPTGGSTATSIAPQGSQTGTSGATASNGSSSPNGANLAALPAADSHSSSSFPVGAMVAVIVMLALLGIAGVLFGPKLAKRR